ncbi:MAG: hypothetical protein PVJ86_12490 [Phycisphaerales bacterium]|jgi:hypothetical protein
MRNANHRCRNCEYFDRHGKCHRYPPKIFMMGEARNVKFVRQLPNVNHDEYCGEFEPRGPLVNAPVAISASS